MEFNSILECITDTGVALLNARQQPLSVSYKSDGSPVSNADILAHNMLANGLRPTGLPLLSEENIDSIQLDDFTETQDYWLADPLDGTRGYLNGKNDFAICLALMRHGKPAWGAIYAPALDILAYGGAEYDLHIRPALSKPYSHAEHGKRLILSAHRPQDAALSRDWLAQYHPDIRISHVIHISSAVKFLYLVQHKADLYARFGAVSLWDIAAGQALIESIGGKVTDTHNTPIQYAPKHSLEIASLIALAR